MRLENTILADRLRRVLQDPRTNDDFDIHRHLEEMLAEIGFCPQDCGGVVTFDGRDPILPSSIRIGGAAALGLVQQSVVAAAIHRLRGGAGQDIRVQLAHAIRRLAPFSERKFELLNGHPAPVQDPSLRFLLKFYRSADDREVLPANLYPRLKNGMLELLRCQDDMASIAAAIRKWRADDLETAFEQAGLVLCKVRTVEEFIEEPVFDYLASRPLIEVQKVAESDPEPLPPLGRAPLSNVRALGMGHVIAGAGIGRSLASLGTDVLNVWRPDEFEYEALYLTANVGMRSCRIDPRTDQGRDVLVGLIREADIFFANRRPGLLRELGLDVAAMVKIRPGDRRASRV